MLLAHRHRVSKLPKREARNAERNSTYPGMISGVLRDGRVLLCRREDLARLLQRLPGLVAARASLHAGLGLAHPLGHRLVAILGRGGHLRGRPFLALLHDARRHGLRALLQALVRGSLLWATALQREDLRGAASSLRVLPADGRARRVVGALAAVGGAARLGLVRDRALQAGDSSGARRIGLLRGGPRARQRRA